MKKVINILFSIVFLISFIGVNMHEHYSHGKLYSTAIFHKAKDCCADMDHCEMTNNSVKGKNQQEDDCSCEDKTETFKICDNFVHERFSLPTEKTTDLQFVSLFQTIETTTFFTTYNNTNLFPPPLPLNKTDIQSEFCVFLI